MIIASSFTKLSGLCAPRAQRRFANRFIRARSDGGAYASSYSDLSSRSCTLPMIEVVLLPLNGLPITCDTISYPVNEVGRARISIMVRSMSSNSRPDTLVQDRVPQPHRFLLPTHGGSIHWGQALSDYPLLRCRCRARARASLRKSAPRPLYGAFLVKRFEQGGASFFHRQFLCSI